jgi:glycosyltransferase involved in cell wall biosynthesis
MKDPSQPQSQHVHMVPATPSGAESNGRVKVLHVITRLIVGGAQENTIYTVAMLDRERYQVELIAGSQTGSEGSLMAEARQRGVPLVILPELVREVNPGYDLAALWKLFRLMRREHYTIVHTHSSKAGILGRMAAWLAGVPLVVHTVHGWSFHEYMPARTRAMYIGLEKLTAKMSDALIAVNHNDIDKGLRFGIGKPAQYHLIRSAIPLDEFDPARINPLAVREELGVPPGAPVLGNVGRFSEQKNPLDWVRVAARVGRAMLDCHFLLVGDGPLKDQVVALLHVEGLADRAVLTGLRRDVPRMLAAMDVFLLTSLWEGLPRVIPQALAMRVPVVANQVDGSAEAIRSGETGFTCAPGDLDGLANRCLEILRDPDRRRKMGERGRVFALQAFDLNQMIRQIDRLYEELLTK